MSGENYERFRALTYDKFRQMALDETLSLNEKVGFPDSYRKGAEEQILTDIASKLSNLRQREKLIMDIGPGCSNLARLFLDLCRRNGHKAIFVDSAEMLGYLPDEPFLMKVPGYYPSSCDALFNQYRGKIDAILTYSVLQYVFVESNVFDFLDQSLTLLSERGEMLIGDIPNISKRKRFFASQAGVAFHSSFMGTDVPPKVEFNTLELSQIDDAVVSAIVMRCRTAGFDAYIMPQAEGLPFANRREDILIRKP